MTIPTFKLSRPLLGALVEVTISAPKPEAWLQTAAGKALALMENVQRSMSFHNSLSDIARLNHCGHLAPLIVHPWTRQLIERAVKLSVSTEGAFDITLAPKQMNWGYLPKHQSARMLVEGGSWSDIIFPAPNQVQFLRPLQIDLASIAKGFAIDKAIDYLDAKGVHSAMVNAGGDFRTCGEGPHPIHHRHSTSPMENFIPSVLPRPAVSTSAAYFARKRSGLAKASPILHPHSGKPMKSNLSVSVFAPTCVQADALTQAVLLAPQAVWNRVLQEQNSMAMIVTAKGEQVFFPV